MTTTRWTTTADVPPSAWAALVSDIRTLLGLLGAGGAKVTDPTGNTAPVLGAERIAFTVTLPDRGPLTVQFTRAAGDAEVDTSSPITDGLVLAAVNRAAQHWGMLLTVTSDAGTTARALADTVVEGLFGDQDRSVAGGAALTVEAQIAQAVARAQDAVSIAAAGAPQTVGQRLDGVIAELSAQRAGITAAASLLPHPEPKPDPAPAPEPEPTPEEPAADEPPVDDVPKGDQAGTPVITD